MCPGNRRTSIVFGLDQLFPSFPARIPRFVDLELSYALSRSRDRAGDLVIFLRVVISQSLDEKAAARLGGHSTGIVLGGWLIVRGPFILLLPVLMPLLT